MDPGREDRVSFHRLSVSVVLSVLCTISGWSAVHGASPAAGERDLAPAFL